MLCNYWVVRRLFMVGGLNENVGHHGWPMTKNFKIALDQNALKQTQQMIHMFGVYLLISDFLKVLQPTKTIKKDH